MTRREGLFCVAIFNIAVTVGFTWALGAGASGLWVIPMLTHAVIGVGCLTVAALD